MGEAERRSLRSVTSRTGPSQRLLTCADGLTDRGDLWEYDPSHATAQGRNSFVCIPGRSGAHFELPSRVSL